MATSGPGIYVDLDDTLIWACRRRDKNGDCVRVELKNGSLFYSDLRPFANLMLGSLRKIGRVKMLTTATRDYAIAHNRSLFLGFEEEDILAREDYTVTVRLAYGSVWEPSKTKVDPQSVLIDNLSPGSENSVIKIAYLGIRKENYFQLGEFHGRNQTDLKQEVEGIVQKIKVIAAGWEVSQMGQVETVGAEDAP